MIPNRKKPYKDDSPVHTINRVRSILNEIGIFVSEHFVKNGNFYACRIVIANEGLSQYCIGTNGKGITLEYAFASAYAEFLERLQNGILIPETFFFSKHYHSEGVFKKQLLKDDNEINCVYGQDEIVCEIDRIVAENFDVLGKLFCVEDKVEMLEFFVNELGYSKDFCVPYYCMDSGTIRYFPMNLLLQSTSSTGMCAGNTPEEAIVQGLSEILERYATAEIYWNNITPPTIPHEYFRDYPIFDLIKELEELGLTIIIKDFSLHIQLPVIGVVVIDKKTRRYNVKVGADPWPITALERCLTEIHQNLGGIRLIDRCDYGRHLDTLNNCLNELDAKYLNLSNIMNNATGQWPDSLFYDSYSYDFSGFDYFGRQNNEQDMNDLIGSINRLGARIFIRDVSFLQFKSYHIVIPELAQDKRCLSNFLVFNELIKITPLINKISTLSRDEMRVVQKTLEDNLYLLKNNHYNFNAIFLYNIEVEAMTHMSIDLFLCMLCYKMGDNEKSYLYLDNYLKDKDAVNYLYYFGCKDYLSLLLKNRCLLEIQSFLSLFYGKDLSDEIIEDMSNPNDVFKSYNFGSFFSCKTADISNFGYYKMAPILKTIEAIKINNPINQMNLSSLFHNAY